MSHDEFKERVARIEKTHAAERRASTGGIIPWMNGAIWGLLFGAALMFTNANYEQLKADAATDVAMETLFYGLLIFIIGSLILFLGGVLRRRFSKKFRMRRGWGLVFGFFLGLAVSALAFRFLEGSVDWQGLLRL